MDAVTYSIDPDQPQAWCAQCQLPSATRINVHWASEHGDMWATVLMCRDNADHIAIAET
jgi:hypothetical protein